jgi:hypothetical protein
VTRARRLLAVELAGAALRELLPALRRLADAMDPAGTAPGWTPLPPPVVVVPDRVPAAWLEMERRP